MEEKLKSEGVCVYCGKKFSKQGMSRHLNTHLKQLPGEENKIALHLRIDASPYFLNLLIDGSATLKQLDRFLRQIWLECCGHLSMFSYERWGEDLPMSAKVQRVLGPGASLWYAYDFGSTTDLIIRCLGGYPLTVKKGIEILSRNEPLMIMCDRCGKAPAEYLCLVHWEEDEHRFFCPACATTHEQECEGGEQMVTVSNSPRMGVCGYEGGTIDLERDRVKG